MKKRLSLLGGIILISIVLISCSSTNKLEKLGYNKELIEEVIEQNYEKQIIKNGVSHDKFNDIKQNKYYQKDNILFYIQLSNSIYGLDDLDKLVVGANEIAKVESDAAVFFNESKENIIESIEVALKPKLEFKLKEVDGTLQNNKEELIKSVLIADSKFDGSIIQNVTISSDLRGDVIGEYDVKVEAYDSKGYTATLEDKIKVVDKEAPTIEIPGNIELFVGDKIDLMSGVTVMDNVDGDLIEKVVLDKGSFSVDKAGKHTVTYKVVDSAGNESEKSRTITILPAVKFKESFVINKYNIIVNSCTFNRTDTEPQDGYYQYYNAEEDQIFYICKIQIKNENDIQRKPFDIFGTDSEKLRAELIYKNQYKYDSVAHRIDNNWYDTFVSLKPLTSSTKNLTFEVPLEVKGSKESVVIKFSSYETSDNAVYLKIS
ncbi:immunoglobulin-like domain-containing protein [Paenibacillus yanchengensis]|uniref:Immunoglobulin-like domain-containing protein n=1 Tax=Paenibacillus yanchengensis TaxID=2035833 RepID=A0ABW4YFG2_9BACL